MAKTRLRPLVFWSWDFPRDSIHHDTPSAFPHIVPLHTKHHSPKSTVHTYTCIHAASPVYPSLYPGNLLELLGLLLPALAMLLRGKDFLGQLRKVLALGQEKPLGPLLIGSVISGVYKLGQFQ